MAPVWSLVQAERAALIEDLRQLDDAGWDEPSVCGGWTVHDVAAHLVDTALTTRVGFVAGLVRARFDFDRQNARGVERHRGASPRETLERLHRAGPRTSSPPAPLDSRLVEEVVHGEDIRRPPGLTRRYPSEAVVRALGYQARTPSSFGGAKELTGGVRLTATDVDHAIGRGPQVRGPVLSLLLVAAGRQAALENLDGPGLASLTNHDAWRVEVGGHAANHAVTDDGVPQSEP